MSNQEPQNPDKTTEETAVENRRRFIKGAGATVPVILTLASPSVFGNGVNPGCYSQQISGNTSPGHTLGCRKGLPPSDWVKPTNKDSWPLMTPTNSFLYGNRITSPSNNGSLCSHYSGGTLMNAAIAFSGRGSGQPMRALLCNSLTSSNSIWSTAMLNAVYFSNNTLGYYILSRQQILDLWDGKIAPPYPLLYPNTPAGKLLYLQSTW